MWHTYCAYCASPYTAKCGIRIVHSANQSCFLRIDPSFKANAIDINITKLYYRNLLCRHSQGGNVRLCTCIVGISQKEFNFYDSTLSEITSKCGVRRGISVSHVHHANQSHGSMFIVLLLMNIVHRSAINLCEYKIMQIGQFLRFFKLYAILNYAIVLSERFFNY